MMNNVIIRSSDYEDLTEYLINTGWLIDKPTEMWVVFTGAEDAEGDSLEIVLPSTETAPDIHKYIRNAVNTLAAINDKPPDELATDIKYYDRDVLRVRNLETKDLDSIPLKVAAQQVSELKQLVAYSALSEEEPKPFFINTKRKFAQRMVERYQFGHTFRGSFGYTVETPKISKQKFSVGKSFFPEVDDMRIMPAERRVMERIVRGLLITQEATSEREVNKIIHGYKSGFNSNMCSAIVNMSLGKKTSLEYSVSWSVVEPPGDDNIQDPGSIRLSEHSYDHLDFAAKRMIDLEPEVLTIRGSVTDLSARDNPLGLDTPRTVIIRWEYEENKVHYVSVLLGKDDYVNAIRAHKNWIPVVITGVLKKVKKNWRIIEYSEFRLDTG